MAFEKVTGFAQYVLSNINKKNNALFEFRTKSIQIEPFLNSSPNHNVIVAYSLIPEKMSTKLDNKTPSIAKRVNAMTKISKLRLPKKAFQNPVPRLVPCLECI